MDHKSSGQRLFEDYYARIKDSLVTSGVSGLSLDLDDTLADTNVYWAQHFISELGNPEGLDTYGIIKKYRYVKDVPYWDNSITDPWITKNHLSDNEKTRLPIMFNSINWIQEIQKTIPFSIYLTGRPQNTIDGTQKWINSKGLPDLPILAQPNKKVLEKMNLLDGNEWKTKVLEYLFPEIKGTIDDNLKLAEATTKNYQGTIYLFSQDVGTIVSRNVVCCPSGEDLIKEIKLRNTN